MELKLLRLQNFLTFKELKHTFVTEPVLIRGKNLTEIESKETNGAGKSTLEAGISFAILATSLRKQTLDKDLIRWGEEEAHIWLDIYCPIRKQTLNIHRTLRQKGSQLLELTINEETDSVKFATVSDGNDFILNWIGISAADLKNYYLINKENFKSFVSSSNTDKLALISRFIKAEQLDTADAVIKTRNAPLQVKAQEAAAKVFKIEGELGVYKEQLIQEQERNLEQEKTDRLDMLNARMDNIITRYDAAELKKKNAEMTIALANDRIAENNKKLTKFNQQLEKLNALSFVDRYTSIDTRRSITEAEVHVKKEDANKAKERAATLGAEIAKLNKTLEGAVECPKCHHKFAITNPDVPLATLEKQVQDKTAKKEKETKQADEVLAGLNKLLTQLQTYDNEYVEVRKEEQENIKAVRKLQSDITTIKYQVADSTRLKESTEKEIKELDVIMEQCNTESEALLVEIEQLEQTQLETREEELQGLITVAEKKLAKATKEREDLEAQIAENVQWGLRMKEFKMSLACEQLRIIQNFANLALQKQRSELRLAIDGFKRNANGKVKEEINVTVINGEGEYKPFWSFSGGERSRIEVALIQAFQEMINGTNPWGGLHFLMIDEVLEGTDPLGLALLLESLNEVGYPVYVISHVMNIRAGVTTLTVVKENGESYIE